MPKKDSKPTRYAGYTPHVSPMSPYISLYLPISPRTEEGLEAHAVRGLGGAPAEGGRLRLQLGRCGRDKGEMWARYRGGIGVRLQLGGALVEADRRGRRQLAARLG